jgi:hypothetical protein
MPSNTNFPEMHQSKADLQRIYRGKEGEGFAELQQAIREVTEGKVDLAKRHETLMKAAQKIRELNRQNEELRRQLNKSSSPRGGQGGQTHGAWSGGTTATPYAPVSGYGALGNNFSAAQYPAQYYPGNVVPSDPNFLQGYPGQGRGN